MSVESSSSSNVSFPPSLDPPSQNMLSLLHGCLNSTTATLGITAYTVTSILFILPLCIVVLYLGLQQRMQQRTSKPMSHSEVFTYNIIAIELINITGLVLLCCGIYTGLQPMLIAGIYFFGVNLSGQMAFHTLTCIERYLAVVHPVTYLHLKKANRIRNITVVFVWLYCIALLHFSMIKSDNIMIFIYFGITTSIIIVIAFCNISILRVLNRPGPCDRVGGRVQVDQSKLKAFYTVRAILGMLLIRLAGDVFTAILYVSLDQRNTQICVLVLITVWFCLPSSLLLPFLVIHRAGKLACWKNNR